MPQFTLDVSIAWTRERLAASTDVVEGLSGIAGGTGFTYVVSDLGESDILVAIIQRLQRVGHAGVDPAAVARCGR